MIRKSIIISIFVTLILVSIVTAVKPISNTTNSTNSNNNSNNNNNNGNHGAIWTTAEGCASPQNENHYFINDSVYINGRDFNSGTYAWSITGKPGNASCDPNQIVASGVIINQTNFCFKAYTIQPGDCGEYGTEVGNKKDNYRVSAGGEDIVPEFTTIGAGLVLIGAAAFALRKRNNSFLRNFK